MVDVLDANVKYILRSESDGKVIFKGSDDFCKNSRLEELCSLPAQETHVFTYSDKLVRAIPSFFKMLTFNARLQLFNQDGIMFLCLDVVAMAH